MKKGLHVMNDPRLDRIFTEAWHSTMHEVATVERGKTLSDHIDAYADLFERDLASRDLTSSERKRFVDTFKTYIRDADKRRFEEDTRKRRKNRAFVTIAVFIAALGTGIFIARQKPFMSTETMRSDLETAIEQVDRGYGEYAKKFYSMLDSYEARLGAGTTAGYLQRMRSELDEHLQSLLQEIRNGNIVYQDDAKDWAGYYPTAEERKAKKDEVDNVFQSALGKKVEKSIETVAEETKSLLKNVADFIEKQIEKIR